MKFSEINKCLRCGGNIIIINHCIKRCEKYPSKCFTIIKKYKEDDTINYVNMKIPKYWIFIDYIKNRTKINHII